MAIANLVDSFYKLSISTDGTKFNKIEHLQKCDVPSEEQVLDEVTSTEDHRTVKARVNFKEDGEVEFEYVLDPQDETHRMIQTTFDTGAEATFKLEFINVPSESRQFKGIIAKLTTNAEDTKKKIRKSGTITITSDVTKVA